jgi:hypothetical protein
MEVGVTHHPGPIRSDRTGLVNIDGASPAKITLRSTNNEYLHRRPMKVFRRLRDMPIEKRSCVVERTTRRSYRSLFVTFTLLFALLHPFNAAAQKDHDKTRTGGMALFRDSTDGAFDMSTYLIEANGFITMPFVLSEPALGGFGLGLGLIFLQKKNIPAGLSDRSGKPLYVPPDITLVGGFYTANDSWGVMGGRIGTVLPWKLRYRVLGGFMNVNMDYYRDLPLLGETSLEVNMQATPIFLQAMRTIGNSKWYLGGQYLWSGMDLTSDLGRIGEVLGPIEKNTTSSILGGMLEYDGRNNFFSPTRGINWHANYQWSGSEIGSTSDYTQLVTYAPFYLPVNDNWTCGLRGEYRQVWGDPLFYQLPAIDLRGVPAMRYQGRHISQLETEQNFHVWRRWNMVAFGGVAKAFDEATDFNDAELVYGVGLGPRYLIAREFGLQMGVDFAHGPEDFAWYLVFGSAWLR